MMSLVLQHLETLQLDLTAIDPTHRIEAADKVAAMASELRRVASDAPLSKNELFDPERAAMPPIARNH